MLFNSMEFIFLFLPITLIGLYILGKYQLTRIAMGWLVISSSIFYGWFSIKYLILFWFLIIFNFYMGKSFTQNHILNKKKPSWLILGIIINLSVLIYFKYTNFLITNINDVFGTTFNFLHVFLPIGISFFIFQKIAYLVDAYYGEAKEYDFLSFCLFVLFFPQLIAGPIVHHKEIIPQFNKPSIFKLSDINLASGIILFSIGLVKKVCIADHLVFISDSVFLAAKNGTALGLIDSWRGALAFTFQIYFDFSGYTDMAIGLGLMCGIVLPQNFNSPYKATNIIDFWRRWHISLSQFLRDYLYIALGGNRKGHVLRYINLMITMLIGGLWHGAAWTFIVWGGIHGLYLIINHMFRYFSAYFNWIPQSVNFWGGRLLTFYIVIIAWVFFRAEGFHSALAMLQGMTGFNGLGLITNELQFGYFKNACLFLALFIWVWFPPNSQTVINYILPELRLLKDSNLGLNLLFSKIAPILTNQQSLISPLISVSVGIISGALMLGILIYQSIHSTTLHQFIYFQF